MTGQVHLELYIAQTGACWNTSHSGSKQSTIPTTSGSDGRLRYGCTLPQHHPHHRPEYSCPQSSTPCVIYGRVLDLALCGDSQLLSW